MLYRTIFYTDMVQTDSNWRTARTSEALVMGT
jgi:hypothetical protein